MKVTELRCCCGAHLNPSPTCVHQGSWQPEDRLSYGSPRYAEQPLPVAVAWTIFVLGCKMVEDWTHTAEGEGPQHLEVRRRTFNKIVSSIRSWKAHKTAVMARSLLSNPDLFNKVPAAASCSLLERIAERSGATVDTHVCWALIQLSLPTQDQRECWGAGKAGGGRPS